MGFKDQLEAIKKQAAEKAAEKAKTERAETLPAEYEMLEASLSEAEKGGAGAQETIKEIEDMGELDPETTEQIVNLKSNAEMAIDKITNLRSELERVKAELSGAESAEPVVESAQAEAPAETVPAEIAPETLKEETAEVVPAETAVEEKMEAPKTPEESLQQLNALFKEISPMVKESQEIDFEKIEDAEQRLSLLKSSREKILTVINDTIEAYQSAGNSEKVKKLLRQAITAVKNAKIDDAIDLYARKTNGLTKESERGEIQLQTEYSRKEAELIMRRVELDAELSGRDSAEKEMWALGGIRGALGEFGDLSSKLSPEAIKIF